MKKKSLKVKFLFLIWGLLAISLTIPGLFFTSILQKEVKQDVVINVKKELNLIKWILCHSFKGTSARDMDKFIKEIGSIIGDRITYILEDGEVIADSKVPSNQIKYMDNHAARPEIVQARHRGWGSSIRFSGTLKTPLIYYAEKIPPSKYLPRGYLRIARPYSPIAEELSHIKTGIWQITLLCFIISGIIIFLFLSRFTRSFNPMIEVAQALGRGEQGKRVVESPGKEFEPLVKAINVMATNIEENMKLIDMQKTELRAILDGIDVGIVAIDKHGIILQHNLFFETICNLSYKEIRNNNINSIIINTKLLSAIDKSINKKKNIKNLDIKLGNKFYNINIISEYNHGNISTLLIFHDITDRKRVENMRRDFVANISHELRTPLTSILGYTELLLENKELSQENIQKFLKIIQKNTEEMIYLIEDILNLAKIESGKIKFRIQKVSIKEIAQKSWEKYKAMGEEKGITFINLSKDMFVQGDREKLLIVFNNLIHNSIKFTPDGGKIKIIGEDKGKHMAIGIKDNGVGIPLMEQSRIFERFYQVKRFRPKGIKGSGLGLSICRNIIRGMGGEIWVESPPKGEPRGCVIWFTLKKEGKNEGTEREEDRSKET